MAMIANTALEHVFDGVSGQDQVQTICRWAVAETDVEAIDESVDKILAGADDDEW